MAVGTNLGDMVVRLIANTRQFERGMNQAQRTINNFSRNAKRFGIAGGVAVGGAMALMGARALQAAADFETLSVQFKTLLRDADLGDRMLQQIDLFARKVSPFPLRDLIQGTKQMLAFGQSAEDAWDITRRLADVAALSDIGMPELINVFGRNLSQGIIRTRDITELSMRGFPVRERIAEMLGLGDFKDVGVQGRVQQAIENRMVTPQMMADILRRETDPGGRFFQGQQVRADTTAGKMEKLSDAWDKFLRSVGRFAIPPAIQALDAGTAAFDAMGDVVSGVERLEKAMAPGQGINRFGIASADKQQAHFAALLAGRPTTAEILRAGPGRANQLRAESRRRRIREHPFNSFIGRNGQRETTGLGGLGVLLDEILKPSGSALLSRAQAFGQQAQGFGSTLMNTFFGGSSGESINRLQKRLDAAREPFEKGARRISEQRFAGSAVRGSAEAMRQILRAQRRNEVEKELKVHTRKLEQLIQLIRDQGLEVTEDFEVQEPI